MEEEMRRKAAQASRDYLNRKITLEEAAEIIKPYIQKANVRIMELSKAIKIGCTPFTVKRYIDFIEAGGYHGEE